jgi:hypothetical protein
VAVGASPTMVEPAAEASPSRAQMGAATPGIVPEVDTTTATGVATADDGDDNELEVVMGHPRLQALGHVSLSEEMSMVDFALHQAQDVL